MKKLILSLTVVAFAVALHAGEDCAKACATKAATCDKAKATAATCDKATAKATTCDKATAKATTCDKATAKATTCCASKTVKADATAKGATQLAKR
jgi:hypothetical protein